MKKLIVTAAIVSALLLAVTAFSFESGSGKCSFDDSGIRRHYDAVWHKMNLSAEQKTKIETIRTAAYKELRPLREKMFDKSMELRHLWLQPNPDEEKILNAQKEINKLRDAISDKVTAMKLEIHKVLTPEQIKKFADLNWGRRGYAPRGAERGSRATCPGGYF